MNIALITPKGINSRAKPWMQKFLSYYRLTMPLLAAHTPKEHHLEIIDENVEPLPNKDFDIVGISVMTSSAPRSYEIAKIYHAKGAKVILGGAHVTAMPSEAVKFSDAVVTHKGAGAWEKLIKDIEQNKLLTVYDGRKYPFERKIPKRDLIESKYFWAVPTIQTTEGCNWNCRFCSVAIIDEDGFKTLPLEYIKKDLESIKKKHVGILDDNLFFERKFNIEFFSIIKSLGKTWATQAPVTIGRDKDLLKLMHDAGCIFVYLGIDSIIEESRIEANLYPYKIDNFETYIKNIHDSGISVGAGYVLGFDHDDEATVDKTLEFSMKHPINSISFHILTPYPGTDYFRQFSLEGRLLHKNWEEYNNATVVFRPKNWDQNPEELQEDYDRAIMEANRLSNIIKRSTKSPRPILDLGYNLAVKLAQS